MGKIGGYLSPSKPLNLLVGLIIFFSATQLGLHFWPTSSLVYGIRIDYLSPTLYFLDLLIVLFLFLRRLLDRRPEQSSSRDAEGGRSLLVGLFPILLTNLLYSANPLATLSWSLHFLLYMVFFVALRSDLKGSAHPADSRAGRSDPVGAISETGSDPKVVIVPILTLSLLFQLFLSISQVFLGRSVGGLMYYLGERTVVVGAPSIALGSFAHEVVLRAYGTFGHPNVLAGWAVISLLIILQLRPQGLTLKEVPNPASKYIWRGRSDPKGNCVFSRPYLITAHILCITAY